MSRDDGFERIRVAYASWYEDVWNVCQHAQDYMNEHPSGGEDLGDFIDAITTMMSFGPNPKNFSKEV